MYLFQDGAKCSGETQQNLEKRQEKGYRECLVPNPRFKINRFLVHHKCNTTHVPVSLWYVCFYNFICCCSSSSHLLVHHHTSPSHTSRRTNTQQPKNNCLTHVIQYRGSFHECSVWFIQVVDDDVAGCRLLAFSKSYIDRICCALHVHNVTCIYNSMRDARST